MLAMLSAVRMEFHLFEDPFQCFGRHQSSNNNLRCLHAWWDTITLLAKSYTQYLFMHSGLIRHQQVLHLISSGARAPKRSAEGSH